jgi:hypothetical protein
VSIDKPEQSTMAGVLSNVFVRGVFDGLFDDYQLFDYVGERERLRRDLESLGYGAIKALFSGLNPFVKKWTGLSMEDVVKELQSRQDRKAPVTKLHDLHRRLKSKGSYFPTVQIANPTSPPLLPASSRLPGTLVCVEGCLTHSSVLAHYYPQARPQLADASAWLMTDGPPHLLASSRFTGELLILEFEAAAAALLRDSMPFWTDIGWYPYARVTGYFKAASVQTHQFSALTVAVVEYRPPKAYAAGSNALESRLRTEFTSGNASNQSLTSLEDRITATYLAPLISKRANQPAPATPQALSGLLKQLRQAVGAGMPPALDGFYRALP